MKFDLKNAVIKIKDGGSNELTLRIGEGTFTYSEKKAIEYVKDRGRLDTVREGDEQEMDVRFDGILDFWYSETGAGTVTPYEALKGVGEASDWVTSSDDTCEPYAVDLEVTHTPICANEEPERVLFPDFRYEDISFDLKAGTFSVSGKSNAKEPVISRAASGTF